MCIQNNIYICKVINNEKTKKQKNMKTRNQEIKVKANESKRTFTIRTYVDGKLNAKYRTTQMYKDEFKSNKSNTDNDWFQFLRTSDYYDVK